MKITPINLFFTDREQNKQQKNNTSFTSIPMKEDSFIKKENFQVNEFIEHKALSEEDAQFILESGEVLLKKYKTATTKEQKDEVVKTYQKAVKETLTSKPEYNAIRHYWGNHFSMGLFGEYHFLRLSDAPEEENEKLIEDIITNTTDIINFNQSLSKNSKTTNYDVLTQIIKNEKNTLKKRNINIEIKNENLLKKQHKNIWLYENFVIMSNLIQNAIKYSPDNSTIKINFEEETKIEQGKIKRINEKHILYFVIEDEGIGIPKENQETIFEGGYRGNNVGSIQGTGQGLNDVKKSIVGEKEKYIEIISPLRPDEPIYKGTKIKCPLNTN